MIKKRPAVLAGAICALAALVLAGAPASADPDNTNPGTAPSGKTPAQIYAGVGADSFAELTNNVAASYNATNPAVVLASYDAVNPATGAAGETITTKPGCSLPRPNGANAGISAILAGNKSTVDPTSYCVDFVRSSRAKSNPPGGEANLTFYAQSRDAVSYATLGNAYAPTTPLTTTNLKDIFECTVTDWSQVGGQAGPIHLYLPPATAATYTFFLQAIGTTVNNVTTGCGTSNPNVHAAQQNDGRTLLGDPEGIAPYAVTKWAAQSNRTTTTNPALATYVGDNRGGVQIGLVNTATAPLTTQTYNSATYAVLNPAFTASGTGSPPFGRYFFNVVRSDGPADLKTVFQTGGYLCSNASQFLVPFGNETIGTDCGRTDLAG